MPVKKPREFLDSHGVKYTVIRHSPAYTAQETAASAHISDRELAKTVMVRIDGEMAMAVLPASRRVDLDLLRKTSRARSVTLADSPLLVRNRFPLFLFDRRDKSHRIVLQSYL